LATFQLHNAPQFLPINIDEAKIHSRIIGSDDDASAYAYLMAAIQKAEAYTWRPLGLQVWKLYLDAHEVNEYIYLSKSPVISVDSVQYYNQSNALTTLPTNAYSVDTTSDPGRIRVPSWPSIYDRMGAVIITFTCGYQALVGTAITAASVDITTNTITQTAHALAINAPLYLTNLGTVTGIELSKLYYAKVTGPNSFQLSLSPGGPAVDLTGTATTAPTYQQIKPIPDMLRAAILLEFGHLFEHREDVVVGTNVSPLDNGAQVLFNFFRQPYYYSLTSN
jgi:uncharacterized phiE125 gp8 family phage protein